MNHQIRAITFIMALSLCILPSCSTSEKTKDDATETVLETTRAEPFTRDIYDKLLVADAHGSVPAREVFLVTVTITNVKANRENGRTDISLTGTLWAGSKVEGKFVFGESGFDYVAARKPGEVVTLKCQFNDISSATVDFIGALPE